MFLGKLDTEIPLCLTLAGCVHVVAVVTGERVHKGVLGERVLYTAVVIVQPYKTRFVNLKQNKTNIMFDISHIQFDTTKDLVYYLYKHYYLPYAVHGLHE
ncbi:unnamed protein product [Owenia fusiformis]|uniref:Uncharacterized protein n=1 Tax=Owenia fusiformis TaxID=6347 RepID=A0A8S4NA32_OWEFU|nr:unnamed protein product [Owenia fusiformis]